MLGIARVEGVQVTAVHPGSVVVQCQVTIYAEGIDDVGLPRMDVGVIAIIQAAVANFSSVTLQ